MSLPMSDVEEQTNSSNACFHFISSRNDHEPLQNNSNPESSFYCIKNTQQSSFPPSTAPLSRPGNARTIFTIIPPMSQDTANKTNVRNQLAFFFCEFRLSRRLFLRSEKKIIRIYYDISDKSFIFFKSQNCCSFS
jgi:hypothetical protein